MDGIIAKGDRMGRKIGFPTMNLQPGNELYPKDGVYFTSVRIESFERTFACVTNIGRRPTVYEDYATTIESYILDFSSDVYGERVRLSFFDRVREEMTFPSMLELTAQIRRDVEATRLLFPGAPGLMTAEIVLRAAAAALAASPRAAGGSGRRRGRRRWAPSRRSPCWARARDALPEPAEAAALAGGPRAAPRARNAARTLPSITEEAARTAALAAAGAAGAALVSGRRLPGRRRVVLAVLAFLAVSAFAAEACRAGGEAGWREGLARALGVAVPAALGAGLSAALASAGRAARSGSSVGGRWPRPFSPGSRRSSPRAPA